MKEFSVPQVKDYINRLRSMASRIDRMASTMEDFAYADRLKGAAVQLEAWLREGMPDEIPADVNALLLGGEAVETTISAVAEGRRSEASVDIAPEVELDQISMDVIEGEREVEVTEAALDEEVKLVSRARAEIAVTIPQEKVREVAAIEEVATDELRGGMVLHGRRGSYRLVKWLKSELYSRVWLAETTEGELRGQPVVFKVIKPGLSDQERRQFPVEADTIEKIQQYEREHELLLDGHSLVAPVLDREAEQYEALGLQFFVHPHLTGQTLDKWIQFSIDIAEPQALDIARQYCQIVEALHEGAWRGLVDLQLKDIYWHGENGRMTAASLGSMSLLTEALRESDIMTAARLLYRLLLGIPAPEVISQRVVSQPREAWEGISLAAREILVKAFHVNPEMRYSSARTLRHDIEDVIRLWDMPPEQLARMSQEFLPEESRDKALSAEEIDRVQQAVRYISVLEQKGSLSPATQAEVVGLKFRLTDWLTGQGHLENGRHLFYAQEYEAAMSNFQQAVEKAWDVRVALRAVRWMEVVRAAEGLRQNETPLNLSQIRRGIQFFNEEEYEEVIRTFRSIAEQPGGGTLNHLVNEARLWLALRRADGYLQKRQYHLAAERVRGAQQYLRTIPYANLLGEIHGDLRAQAMNLDRRADAAERTVAWLDKIVTSFARSFDEGYRALEEALDEQLAHPRLVSLIGRICREHLSVMNYKDARAVAALGLAYAPQASDLSYLWLLAAHLDAAWIGWLQGNFAELRVNVEQLVSLDEELKSLSPFLRSLFDEATENEDIFRAKVVLDVVPENDPARPEYVKRLDEVREVVWLALNGTFDSSHKLGMDKLKTILKDHPGEADALRLAERQIRAYLDKLDYAKAREVAELAELRAFRELAAGLIHARECFEKRDQAGLTKAMERANKWQSELSSKEG